MNEDLRRETEGLIKSWMRHDEERLRDYLVAGVEDPRINIQSILTRHFLIEALFGDRFAPLMEHELRFGAVMNWLLKLAQKPGGSEDFASLLHALEQGADNAEGLAIPAFLSQTFARLPASVNEWTVPPYIVETLSAQRPTETGPRFVNEQMSTFERIWCRALEKETPRGVRVCEPACGSATDYRFLHSFGIARLVDYVGWDLCEKNIRNARAMFPGTRFEIGNVFEVEAPDKTFDLCLVHDLFEHLSIVALERAAGEICRVTREALCLGFFNMHEEADHIVRAVEDYHWNTLSLGWTSALFEQQGFAVQPVHIGTLLKWRFGCEETHNENAYTFFATAAER
ncbi:MAG: methyltransferase domain-containing protein [Verrucomicrobia bacterium]|nr:methyltransferase domain-containing protein [Verrucomicrobiota bacterium]